MTTVVCNEDNIHGTLTNILTCYLLPDMAVYCLTLFELYYLNIMYTGH